VGHHFLGILPDYELYHNELRNAMKNALKEALEDALRDALKDAMKNTLRLLENPGDVPVLDQSETG
jgi:hypothetical protein